MKCTKHTHYHLQGNADQYISVNSILGIKFCLAVEPTSQGNIKLWALWVAVGAGKGHGGGYIWMNEKAFHLTPVLTRPGLSRIVHSSMFVFVY